MYCKLFSISSEVMVDCPFPDEDINGFTTHGIPTVATLFCQFFGGGGVSIVGSFES
jgi:hypothetical protein